MNKRTTPVFLGPEWTKGQHSANARMIDLADKIAEFIESQPDHNRAIVNGALALCLMGDTAELAANGDEDSSRLCEELRSFYVDIITCAPEPN